MAESFTLCVFSWPLSYLCTFVCLVELPRLYILNHLKPTGYVMHHQFNIQHLYTLPTLYLCAFIYLRTNSDLCRLHHKLTGFYNRDEKCLQRGTDWVFK
jgi:hypothetical protein